MDLKLKDTVFTVCSVYAPTQDRPRQQLETLCKFEGFLEDLSSINIIAGGISTVSWTVLLTGIRRLFHPHTRTRTETVSLHSWISGVFVMSGDCVIWVS